MKSYSLQDAHSVWPPNELLRLTGQKCKSPPVVLMESDKYVTLYAPLLLEFFEFEFHRTHTRRTTVDDEAALEKFH